MQAEPSAHACMHACTAGFAESSKMNAAAFTYRTTPLWPPAAAAAAPAAEEEEEVLLRKTAAGVTPSRFACSSSSCPDTEPAEAAIRGKRRSRCRMKN